MFSDLQLPAVRYEGEMRFYEELVPIRRKRAVSGLVRRYLSEIGVVMRPREVAPAPARAGHDRARSAMGWGWLRPWLRDPVPETAEHVTSPPAQQATDRSAMELQLTCASRGDLAAVETPRRALTG